MSWSTEVVYNRTDCPYGCGTALPTRLYRSATPCPGCQRPLYAHWALHSNSDDRGELWPPQDVPRPPLVPPHGAEVWYVIGEEDHAEWERIGNDLVQDYVRKNRGTWVEGCLYWSACVLWMVVAVIAEAVVRLLRRILGSDHEN
jgi:hypothetical protein